VNHRERGVTEVVVPLAAGRVTRATPRPGAQPAITAAEFAECERAVRADPRFRTALARRGIDDPVRVVVEAWGFGGLAPARYAGRRLAWAPPYYRPTEADNPYPRPIEGVFAVVDLHGPALLEVVDTGVVPLPAEAGRYVPEEVGPLRTDPRPLEVVQPEGPSFEVDGWALAWQKWRLRIGFTPREGLVLHTVAYDGRTVLHPAACAELVVPYGEPGSAGFVKTPFDAGEYGLGTFANSLRLGCDCLGEVRYFDVDLCDDAGEPYTLRNAICLHEEDAGLLWKHVDAPTGRAEVRRSRRLVLSFIATLSNYEYAFYWHLYQDGSIGLEIALTGIVLTAALAEGAPARHGTFVGDRLAASYHQHFFTARLDFDVDGRGNTVYEVDTVPTPPGDENPFGFAFETTERPLRSEAERERQPDPSRARFWRIVNPWVRNAHGLPVGTGWCPPRTSRRSPLRAPTSCAAPPSSAARSG
jgi:primary-amine oxidase